MSGELTLEDLVEISISGNVSNAKALSTEDIYDCVVADEVT